MTDAPQRSVWSDRSGRFAAGNPGRRPLGVVEEAHRSAISLVVEATPVGDAHNRGHRC